MKRALKHSAISIHDYPSNNYHAYWETQFHQSPGGKWRWETRFAEFATGRVVKVDRGEVSGDENAARAAAQANIPPIMAAYRRESPIKVIGPDEAKELVKDFDEARALVRDPAKNADKLPQAFAKIDRIRGLLRANGFQLVEKESIGYAGETKVQQVGV